MIELMALVLGGCCICGLAFGGLFAGIWLLDKTYQFTFGRI